MMLDGDVELLYYDKDKGHFFSVKEYARVKDGFGGRTEVLVVVKDKRVFKE